MQGQLLSVLVKAMRARRVLEIGTLGGYASTHSSSPHVPFLQSTVKRGNGKAMARLS